MGSVLPVVLLSFIGIIIVCNITAGLVSSQTKGQPVYLVLGEVKSSFVLSNEPK